MKLVVAVRYLLIAGALITTSNCRSSNAGLSRFEPISTDLAYPGLPVRPAIPAAPLSASDRIVIRDGHFYTAGSSRTRVRFFGVSLALSANFPSEADGEALAQRLSALGVNIVRLHAIDQPAGHSPDGPEGVLIDAAHPQLDARAVQAISRFIGQLGRHGIYVDLNLFANHTFAPLQPGDTIPPQSKPLPVFDAEMAAWQETYARNLLTALHLRGSPNLALVEINNESTLVDAWQEDNLAKLVTGRFRDELGEQWNAYCKARGLACAALPLLRPTHDDDAAKTAAQFFLDLDQRYTDRMVAAVKAVLGNDVPVSGTQIIHSGRWNHGGFANFDVNRAASFTDAHFYIDHYDFPHRPWDWHDWRISNGWLGDVLGPMFLNVAFARVAGRPFTVSEFNQPWPNGQTSDLLPVVTQFAVSQDWDGLILYDYAHDRAWDRSTPSDFSLRGNLTQLTQFAQCAAYFRRVAPDTPMGRTEITLSRDARITAAADGIAGNLAQWLSTRFDVDPSLAMERQIAIRDDTQFGVHEIASPISSSYFRYDSKARIFTFGSAYAAGVSGFLPAGHAVNSSVLDVTLTPGNRLFATAFLTSLDEKTLSASTQLLLTLPGATMGTVGGVPQRLKSTAMTGAWKTIPSTDKARPSASLYDVSGPVQMERVAATIGLRMAARRVSIAGLDMRGKPLFAVPYRQNGSTITFDVNRDNQPFAASYRITVER